MWRRQGWIHVFSAVAAVAIGNVALADAPTEPKRLSKTCTLDLEMPLFERRDQRDVPRLLPPETVVALRGVVGSLFYVELKDRRRGFLPAGTWLERCTIVEDPDRLVEEQTPDLDAGDLTEGAAALELTKAVSEGTEMATDVIYEQQAKVAALAEARDAAKGAAEGVDATGRQVLRVAVYDFTLDNVATLLGRITSDALLQEIRKLEGVSAIGMDEVREMLDFEAQRQALGCDADDQCLAEIAGALGVDQIIVGSLSETADGRYMNLKRIDQRRARVVASANHRLVIGSGEEFLLTLGTSVSTLFPKREPRPGTTRGVSEKLLVRANPPPISRWVTLSIGAGSLAAAVLGGGFGLAAAHFENEHNRSRPSGIPLESDQYRSWQRDGEYYAGLANGAYLSSALLFSGAAVLSLFTDWNPFDGEKAEAP